MYRLRTRNIPRWRVCWMDEKLIRLALDLGENGLWAIVIYKVVDFVELISFLVLVGFGIRWAVNKLVRDLK